jgi:hypothetical protein
VASTTKKLKIIDFPTITAGIHHAVLALLPNEQSKNQPDYQAIFKRELKRFAEAIELFVKEDPCSSINVTIMEEDTVITKIPKTKKFCSSLKSFFRVKE